MDETIKELLLSIESNRLVIFCGAGLSMPSPSNAPSANEIAEICSRKYRSITGEPLDPAIEKDLNSIAKYFLDKNDFIKTFINRLIPWTRFRGSYNKGHTAIGDFLSCDAIEFVVSTNFDYFVEDSIKELGSTDFVGSIKVTDTCGEEKKYRSLLKIHGCFVRERERTLWCKEQIEMDDEIERRLNGFQSFLNGNLTNKDILFIGFWSDWGYLNDILKERIIDLEPSRVILIDPGTDEMLKAKAPELWDWANKNEFTHEPVSGHEFLDKLRIKFSRRILCRLIEDSINSSVVDFDDISDAESTIPYSLSSEQLYNLRRDFFGVPSHKIIREKNHRTEQQKIGLLHLKFIKAGAQLVSYYNINGKSIRLIHAAGKLLSYVKKIYLDEPPGLYPNEIINVCVGVYDDAYPVDVVRGDSEKTIVRGGISSTWISDDTLNETIGVEIL